MSENGNGSLQLNLGSMENYVLSAPQLVKMCSDMKSVNKLYQKDFKRVEIYDEEEECTISPDSPNSYMF